jgi:hypothetical protein
MTDHMQLRLPAARTSAAVAVAAILVGLGAPAPAQSGDVARLVVGTGADGVWHHGANRKTSAVLAAQYRSAAASFHVSPLADVAITSSGDAYAFVGLYHDFNLSDWTLTPHFSVGAYHHGSGSDLGGAVAFRTGVDIFYRIEALRVGLTVRHMSNAGLYSGNPGTETVMVLLALPWR